jgi:hypothetical protein
MPMINVEYNTEQVPDNDIEILSEGIRDIVSHATDIEDVFVYGNSAKIKVQTAPIEIFIRMSAQKIDNIDVLFSKIEIKLKEWKTETKFPHPINLTLIPMNWKIAIGI